MGVDYKIVEKQILGIISEAKDAAEAMEGVVVQLKADLRHYDWVGIYILKGDHLELGPYCGEPSPHTRIGLNQGICGAAASAKKTIIIDDVHADPRYLACSLKTQAEIVVPIMDRTRCLGEIDIDSYTTRAFTNDDRELLETLAQALAKRIIP